MGIVLMLLHDIIIPLLFDDIVAVVVAASTKGHGKAYGAVAGRSK